jgi:hypothetical protein
MIQNLSLIPEGAIQSSQSEVELIYFDSSSFYDWERHWEEEE